MVDRIKMKVLGKMFGRVKLDSGDNLRYLEAVLRKKGRRGIWMASPFLSLILLTSLSSYPTPTFEDPLTTNPIYSPNNP